MGKPNLTDLQKLGELTGWNVLIPKGLNVIRYLPQIVYGTREDHKNFACIWWDDDYELYRLAAKVNGRHIFNDRKLRCKNLETIVAWARRCEKKYKETVSKYKMKRIQHDF